MEHEFHLEYSDLEKSDYLFETFHCSRNFSTETIQQVLFHLLSNRVFWKLFEHWKQPLIDGELAVVALWAIQQQQIYSVNKKQIIDL